MDALEAFGDHGAHAEEPWPFRRPVARRAGAVLPSREHDQRRALGGILERGVVDGHLLAIGQMDRKGPFRSGGEQILEPNVRERAAHHHFVVAAARAVRVEVNGGDATAHEKLAGRADLADRGDAVAEQTQDARAANVANRSRFFRHTVEVRRLPDVGGRRFPREAVAFGDRQAAPAFVTLEHLCVTLAKHRRLNRAANDIGDFLRRWPDLAEEHRPIHADAEWLVVKVDIDAARERVGDNERRRRQIIGAHFLLNPTFEVAIARQHRADDQVAFADRIRDRFR